MRKTPVQIPPVLTIANESNITEAIDLFAALFVAFWPFKAKEEGSRKRTKNFSLLK